MNESKTFNISPILLNTKLYPPPVTPDMVSRIDLLDRLQWNRRRPLTLISAPAGYGKSVLASMWLQVSGQRGGWVSLDETDNDLHTFVSYLLSAIQTAAPDKLWRTQALLNASALPPVAILARYLLADLDQIETPFLLILDDIHYIHEQRIFDFLEVLLNHPSPVLHLVLVGRQDPPLPIASWRAYQRITEIRLRNLRFSPDETSRFLQQMLNRPISEEIATEWAQNTEGWPVALRLAALSLSNRPQSAHLGVNIPGENQFLEEYFLAEVLTRIPPSLQSYVLKTALLDRFCAPLCEAVCLDDPMEMTGDQFMQWLQKSNFFLINLDPQNEWFRFHHLFQADLQQMLKKQLSCQGLNALHLRASHWFAENGWPGEAIRHALAAHDTATAVEIFALHRRSEMNAEHWRQLERWIRLFPEEVVENDPVLLLTRAFLPLAYGYDMGSLVTKAVDLLATMPEDYPFTQELWAEVAYFTGLGAIMAGQAATVIDAGAKMTDTLPPEAFYLRMQALSLQALGNQMSGNLNQGLQIIQEALSAPAWPVNARAKAFHNQSLLYFMEADLASGQTLAGESIKLALKHNLDATEARYFAGVACYLRNDLTLAEQYLLPVTEYPAQADLFFLVHAGCILTRLYQARKQPEKAEALIQQTRLYLEEIDNRFLLTIFETFQIERALDQGDIARARRLSLTLNIDWRLPFWIWHYYVFQLTPIKLWVTEGTKLDQALSLLKEIDEFLRQMNRKIHRIDVLALQALAYQALDNRPKALEKLGQSLALAAPGQFIRNYIDLGPRMRELLVHLYHQAKKPEGADYLPYMAQILTAFPIEKSDDQKSISPGLIQVDPLTKRELELLKLLATDLATKDIAGEMNVTWATTRTHIKNIYSKLDVHGRYEAVQRAKELGFL